MLRSLITITVLLCSIPVGLAQSEAARHGRTAVAFPGRTTAGHFDGTWYYASREHRVGMFVRTVEDKTEVQLIYRSNRRPESFETDWSGRAEYLLAGQPCGFELDVLEATADRLLGNWRWITSWSGDEREVRSSVDIHRTGDGRQLVIRFPDRTYTARDPEGNEVQVDQAESWTFRKLSHRIVRVEELPF